MKKHIYTFLILFVFIFLTIRFLTNQYRDFWDHRIPISDQSIKGVLKLTGFKIDLIIPKFLPFSMSNNEQLPLIFLKIYLNLKPVWNFFGKQFFIVGTK